MQSFEPKIESLPEPQWRLWQEIRNTPRQFVLYGGTALALQVAHRQSEDFDFFSGRTFSSDELLRGVPYLKGAEILQLEENTLTCVVDRGGEIKVSFFGGLKLGHVQEPLQSEGTNIRVASMLDIAATKLGVIQRRPYYKDYFDIYILLDLGIVLDQALSAAVAIHGPRFDPKLSLRALSFFTDGDLQRLPARMQKRLTLEAESVNLKRLPDIQVIGDIGS